MNEKLKKIFSKEKLQEIKDASGCTDVFFNKVEWECDTARTNYYKLTEQDYLDLETFWNNSEKY